MTSRKTQTRHPSAEMQKEIKLKKTILILSLIFLASCKTVTPFPNVPVYVTDIKNGVCAKYEIVDQANFKVRLIAKLSLRHCQDVVGFGTDGLHEVKNWIREQQSNGFAAPQEFGRQDFQFRDHVVE
jgi:hypothetical protein